MKKQTVLRKLAELKAPLLQFGVTKLGLFGSTVRGENKPGSDIDVLIDFQPEKGEGDFCIVHWFSSLIG